MPPNLNAVDLYNPLSISEKPIHRGDCLDGQRPCPYVSCKYNLYLDINSDTGSIKFNFPDLDVHELSETCALDIADRGGETLEMVGDAINLTRERIRQIVIACLKKMRIKLDLSDCDCDEICRGKTTDGIIDYILHARMPSG